MVTVFRSRLEGAQLVWSVTSMATLLQSGLASSRTMPSLASSTPDGGSGQDTLCSRYQCGRGAWSRPTTAPASPRGTPVRWTPIGRSVPRWCSFQVTRRRH